jgi:hypothetical protein
MVLVATTLLIARGGLVVGRDPYAQQVTLMLLWAPVVLAWLFSPVRGLTGGGASEEEERVVIITSADR